MKSRWITAVFFVFFLIQPVRPALARHTEHPIQIYDRGLAVLSGYRGEPAVLDQAKQVFTGLILRFPQYPQGYLGLSRCSIIDAYLYGKNYNMRILREQALPLAVKALELGPSLREVHENYGVLERIFDENESQQKLIQEYLSLFPDDPQTYFMIAEFIRNQDDLAGAVPYYEQILEMDAPDSLKLKALKRLGLMHLEHLNNPQKAVQYYLQVLEIKPDSPDIQEYLGRAYMKLNDYEKAYSRFKGAIKMNPTEPKIYYFAGRSVDHLGNRELALDYYRTYLKLVNDSSEAKWIRDNHPELARPL